MFVAAFNHGGNAMSLSSPLAIPIHRTNALSAAVTSEVIPPTAAIDSNKETQHHIVTVPPFLPAHHENNDDDDVSTMMYPSLLHQIHILPLLTNEETTTLLKLARTYATENQSWDQQDSTRHVSYQTVDFAIGDSIDLSQYMAQTKFEERVFGALSEAYDVDVEDMSFLDLFCTSYEAKDNTDENNDSDSESRNTMDRLDVHRDGSLLSFTILLSPLEDFEGGGTVFDALGDHDVTTTMDDSTDAHSVLQPSGVIQPPQAGYATLHSGKLLHGGHRVTKGQRIVLVGFVDVDERNVKPGALGNATKEWGRNDVRTFWNERRLSVLKQQQDSRKGKENEQPVWKLKNWRYLPKDTKCATGSNSNNSEGRSSLGQDTSIPTSILDKIESRANFETIRRRRLMSEDKLLREILLPREERGDKIAQEEGGEWMEVDPDSMDGMMLGWDGNGEDVE